MNFLNNIIFFFLAPSFDIISLDTAQQTVTCIFDSQFLPQSSYFLSFSTPLLPSLLVQNEHGKKAPTLATFVAERNCKPQGFSQSFGSVKFKNSSLNTGISKSNVHPTLDPIFS